MNKRLCVSIFLDLTHYFWGASSSQIAYLLQKNLKINLLQLLHLIREEILTYLYKALDHKCTHQTLKSPLLGNSIHKYISQSFHSKPCSIFYRLDFLNPKAVNQSRPREFKEPSVDSGQGKRQVLYLTILSFLTQSDCVDN